jgi:hypothetical protein
LFPDDKVNIYTWVNSEISDLLDNTWWAVNINDSLVDSHLESIPSLRSLTTWTLSCGDSQNLCGNANWALCLVILIFGSSNDFSTCSFQRFDMSASEGHSNDKDETIYQDAYLILWISSWISSPFVFSFSASIFTFAFNLL